MRHDAGNTGRHETPSETGLWDRLRADLNNLGAAYGELPQGHYHEFGSIDHGPSLNCIHCGLHHDNDPERYRPTCIRREPAVTPQAPLTPWGEMLAAIRNGLLGRATSQRRDSEPVDNLSPTDRNAYFDGIILAARKRREALNGLSKHSFSEWCRESEHKAFVEFTDGIEGDILSAAMSRPLDFEPRVGHRGVPIE